MDSFTHQNGDIPAPPSALKMAMAAAKPAPRHAGRSFAVHPVVKFKTDESTPTLDSLDNSSAPQPTTDPVKRSHLDWFDEPTVGVSEHNGYHGEDFAGF